MAMIWFVGGPGDDYIEGGAHGDSLHGGDDILKGKNSCLSAQGKKCGVDILYGDSINKNHDEIGNDILYGGTVSVSESMYGGPGHDILVPTIARVHGAWVTAGAGNDVVFALNFSTGFVTADQIDLGAVDGKTKLDLPLGKTCNVTCDLPWPGKLSRLEDVVPLKASLDQEGEVTMDAELYNKIGKLSVSPSREMTEFQAGMDGDVCICDP